MDDDRREVDADCQINGNTGMEVGVRANSIHRNLILNE